MFRVAIVPSDVPACEYYRARFAAEHLERLGKIQLVDLPDPKVRMAQMSPTSPREAVSITNLPEVDVVVFVRGVLPGRVVDLIPLLQKQGVGVVVDADDAYDRLPATLESLYKVNPRLSKLYNWDHAKRAMKLADVVTISTPPLQRYRSDAFLIRNQIPERYLEIRHNVPHTVGTHPPDLVVGWGGTVRGHPGALRVTHGGVARAVTEHNARFLNVGDGEDVKKDLGLLEPPDVTGIVDLDQYMVEMAKFDVGIAPLELNQYTEAKSWLRPLQNLALGSSFIASCTDEYLELYGELEDWCFHHDRKVPGIFAQPRGRTWYARTSQALEAAQEAGDELSATAREFVKERHTVEAHAHEWLEAWTNAIR